MTTAGLPPIEFTPPLVAPISPYGLEVATAWTETTGVAARRWQPAGVQFRRATHRAPGTSGLWSADWDAAEADLTDDDTKTGPPPKDDDPDPFLAITIYASDRLQQGGNLSEFDRAQAAERLQQTFAIREPIEVETAFATRALADAGTPATADDLVRAVAHLEEGFAATGTFGLIHARVGLLSLAAAGRLIIRDPAEPSVLRTPGGHRWVFGGGYATPLGDKLIASSPTYGWRDEITTTSAMDPLRDLFDVIAERSVVIGYETVIGAVEISQST